MKQDLNITSEKSVIPPSLLGLDELEHEYSFFLESTQGTAIARFPVVRTPRPITAQTVVHICALSGASIRMKRRLLPRITANATAETFIVPYAQGLRYTEASNDRLEERAAAGSAISRETEELFAAAEQEDLQDGVESNFSRRLSALIEKDRDGALAAVATLVADSRHSGLVRGEALHILGQLYDPASRTQRLKLLLEGLKNPSVAVRDGASVGLAFLDDAQAIGPLREAIQAEPSREIRSDMLLVLRQLERNL